jgi:hypothetical protein
LARNDGFMKGSGPGVIPRQPRHVSLGLAAKYKIKGAARSSHQASATDRIDSRCYQDFEIRIDMTVDLLRFRLRRGAYHHVLQRLTRLSACFKQALCSIFYLSSTFEIQYSQPPCTSPTPEPSSRPEWPWLAHWPSARLVTPPTIPFLASLSRSFCCF